MYTVGIVSVYLTKQVRCLPLKKNLIGEVNFYPIIYIKKIMLDFLFLNSCRNFPVGEQYLLQKFNSNSAIF